MNTNLERGDADGFDIHPTLVKRDPADLKLLDVNARFMRKEQYDVLVGNIKRDGALTSVPLAWRDPETGEEIVLSGNHRTMAARDAGLSEIDVMLITEPLSKQQRIAIQLSHNAIAGDDDPGTLRILYETMTDVDLRVYSGLDDKTLDLLEETSVEPMSEANLDYQSVLLTFLPHELEAAEAALENARKMYSGMDKWMLALDQYRPMLEALDTAHNGGNIISTAGAFNLILTVFEENLDSVREFWADEDSEPKKPGQLVPMESVFKTRQVRSGVASRILRAVRKAEKDGDLGGDDAWGFMAMLADAYVEGSERLSFSDEE